MCKRLSRFAKPVLLCLCAVGLSVSVTAAAAANPRNKLPTPASVSTNSTGNENASDVGRSPSSISRKIRLGAKLAELSRTCGCNSASAQESFAGCFSSCLRANGVNPMSAAACAAACASNLLGCAVCAGVGEWIIAACVQYCVWSRWGGLESVRLHTHPNHRAFQARLRISRASAALS